MGRKNYTWEARGGTVARKIPGLRKGSESPSSPWSPGGWPRKCRRRRSRRPANGWCDNVPASLKTCSKLFPDETRVRVPDPGPSMTKTGHVWTQGAR